MTYRFTRAVIANNQGEWSVERDGLRVVRPEGAHSQDGEFLDFGHGDGFCSNR